MPTSKTKRERLERYLSNADEERLAYWLAVWPKWGVKAWKMEVLRVELIRRRLTR